MLKASTPTDLGGPGVGVLRRRMILWDNRDFDDIRAWIAEWNKYRTEHHIGMPDFATDALYSLPLLIAVLKSSRRVETLTVVLVVLTAILAVLTAVLIIRTFL